MRFLNLLANKFFRCRVLVRTRAAFGRTLCGDEGYEARQNCQRVAAHRRYFGEFDPFGDFDLIFRRRASRAQNCRSPDPIPRAHLWRDEHLALASRDDPAWNAWVRREPIEVHLMTVSPRR